MKIESIEITNYGPFFGNHTFSFSDRGLLLVMGDNQDEPRMDSNGCLSGDTLVDCPRDVKRYPKGIPIRDLVGTTPWVYGWREGTIGVFKASRVWKTKRAETIKVKVTPYATARGAGQGGLYIPPQELVGTSDHLVLLADGLTWKALGRLVSGDSLCSLYRRQSGGWRTLLHWTGSATVSEQQFVCSKICGLNERAGIEVHHKDNNKWNHSPDNLEWIDGKRYHEKKNEQKVNSVNHTVVSVEEVGVRDVYDISVPDAGNFIANGIVVHNSGKSSIFDALDWCLFG